MDQKVYAFTAKYTAGLANVIITPVQLTNTFEGKQESTFAIWDTGATNSVITKSLALKLNLKPISKTLTRGVHGIREVNVYYVHIRINNGNIAINAKVTECDELSADGSQGFLIGMDIINLGDFSITNRNNQTVLTFQIPSTHEHDYVKEYDNRIQTPTVKEKIPGRNDPCFCGSGRKYKNCCINK